MASRQKYSIRFSYIHTTEGGGGVVQVWLYKQTCVRTVKIVIGLWSRDGGVLRLRPQVLKETKEPRSIVGAHVPTRAVDTRPP